MIRRRISRRTSLLVGKLFVVTAVGLGLIDAATESHWGFGVLCLACIAVGGSVPTTQCIVASSVAGVAYVVAYGAVESRMFTASPITSDMLSTVFGVAIFCPIVTSVIATASMRHRRWEPRDPNLCRDCSYDLTGNESGVCPECGAKIAS